ncbi:MAG: hypothetical protein RR365_03875 [Bacteroides sp.]
MPRLQHQLRQLYTGKEGRMMAVKIVPAEVPKLEMKLFCLSLSEAAERFFSTPENEQKFHTWLKNREDSICVQKA